MHEHEKRVLAKHLVENGLGKAATARSWESDAGRCTAGWRRRGRRGRGRVRRRSLLDAYKPMIELRLETHPGLTARRLHRELRAAGFEGGYDAVKRYARQVRQRQAVVEPTVRFETAPGLQGQVDFAEFRLPWGRRHALVTVLGYSRLLWFRFYRRQTMEVVMRGLESAFGFFGGVPRELLFDQMKAVVTGDERPSGGKLLRNEEFLRFSRHWGFEVRACRPYRARTKGKVERPIRYIRQDFFYGREFVSDEHLNSEAERWLRQRANVRIHGTLKQRPADRFEFERERLRPLVSRPYASLGRPAAAADEAPPAAAGGVPAVQVEKRPLATYAEIAEGGAA